jgi:flagellar biosynthesis GTPase FlhF
LRDSNTTDSVRSRFGNVDLTEAEYRKLFDLRKAYEDTQGAVPDPSDPEKMRQRSEARRQLEDAYKTALGEDRWSELQKQQDPTWRGLTQLAQQNNISQAILEQAWQQQRQTGEQIMRTLEDRSVPQGQRDNIVQQLTAEYDRSLKNLLGEQAYQQYKQTTPGFLYSSGAGDAFSFVIPPGLPLGTTIRSVDILNGRTDMRTQVRRTVP